MAIKSSETSSSKPNYQLRRRVAAGILATAAFTGVGVAANAGFDVAKAGVANILQGVPEQPSIYNEGNFTEQRQVLPAENGDGSHSLARHIDGHEALNQVELGKYIEQTNPDVFDDGLQAGEQVELPESVKR